MTSKERFLIGGSGALMPVIVTLLAIDLSAIIDDQANFTAGNIVGLVIRYLLLFVVGGYVAYLHTDESKPFKLFELGIVAPALITSLITAQGVNATSTGNEPNQPGTTVRFSLINSAHAESNIQPHEPAKIIIAGGFLSDIIQGASGKAYRKLDRDKPEAERPVKQARPVQQTRPALQAQTVQQSTEIKQRRVSRVTREVEPIGTLEEDKTRLKADIKKAPAIKMERKAVFASRPTLTARENAESARNEADELRKMYEAALIRARKAEMLENAVNQNDQPDKELVR